jgi:hypothetical protein
MTLSASDTHVLQQAVELLERPSFAARASNIVGSPIEKALLALPPAVAGSVQQATHAAISKALDVAILTLGKDDFKAPARNTHKVMSGVSGAVGGFFGLPALALELPVSTTLLLRAIADIARSEGEPIKSTESRLACLEVFALGGNSRSDDATESGYYAVRATLAGMVSEAARYVAEKGLAEGSAPVLVRLINSIAARFGVTVSQKLAAQLVPVIGAAGGASVNLLFMEHFQNIARGHFSVRRLERHYGAGVVQMEYRRLRRQADY